MRERGCSCVGQGSTVRAAGSGRGRPTGPSRGRTTTPLSSVPSATLMPAAIFTCAAALPCCPTALPCSWETYLYITRGLFERHKPIFSLMMALKFAVRWDTGGP